MFTILAAALLAAAPHPAPAADRTFRFDPVEVQAGREVLGNEKLALERGLYTYWFASAESRAAFAADPARYEVQLGGACARMGPLSGTGRPALYAVHEGRLYLFASPQCREGFLKNPAKLLEAPDPLPSVTAESAARGRELLDLALRALGGAAAIDGARSWAEVAEREEVSDGVTYQVKKLRWLDFAGRLREEDHWDDKWWAHCTDGERGWSSSASSESEELAPSQLAALRKEMGRNLVAVLRRRALPGAIVAHAGTREVDGTRAEAVAIAHGGSTDVLAIEPVTGRILAHSYRGRGPSSAFGDLAVRYSDWRAVGELKLPFASEKVFEGQPVEGSQRVLKSIAIDGPLEPALFGPK